MLRLQVLFVSIFVLGAFGTVYVYGDPVGWYYCNTTNAGPSAYCVLGGMIVCGNYTAAGHGTVLGQSAPRTATVTSAVAPTVGECKFTWWWYSCEKSFDCEATCTICTLSGTTATAVDANECVD